MPTPRNIGLVTAGWTPDVGPTETLGEAFTRTLLAAGLRPFVLAAESHPWRPPYAAEEQRIAGVALRRINMPECAPKSASELGPDPRVDAVARAWIADNRLDLVHVFDTGPFGLGALGAAQRANLATVASLTDHASLCPRRRMVDAGARPCSAPSARRCALCQAQTWLRVESDVSSAARRTSRALACLRGTDVLLAPSQATIELMVRAGLERSRFELCPPGVENQTLALSVELARAGMPQGRRLGVLGATRPSSGVLELAHAVCLADRPGLTLEVHGPLVDSHGDATYLNALRRLADLDSRVRLHGPYDRHELPSVLATLDGVAAPDRWQAPMAMTLREARAVGLPVLASPLGVHAELANDPGVTLTASDQMSDWVAALRGFEFERTRPAPVRSLLSMAVQILALYRGAAKCGPVPSTFDRSSVQPSGSRVSAAPRPGSI